MATKASHASGTTQNDHDLRQRKAGEGENGSAVAPRAEPDDKKSFQVQSPFDRELRHSLNKVLDSPNIPRVPFSKPWMNTNSSSHP